MDWCPHGRSRGTMCERESPNPGVQGATTPWTWTFACEHRKGGSSALCDPRWALRIRKRATGLGQALRTWDA